MRGLAERVLTLSGNQNLNAKLDVVRDVVPNTPEQAPDIAAPEVASSDRERRLDQRLVGKGGQESDRVEDVRLPHTVGPRDASEWPQPDVDSVEVLEPFDL